jgi:branched-chain amino acid transport system substrate-binding protein
VIKVGEFASLSGSEASFGRSSHNGTVLAIEEINAAGGVLGKKLELIYEDDQSKDGESATAVKKLISRDKVVAILGEVASGRSLEAAPICQQYKVPQISPSSTNPRVTQMGDYIFRVCFEDRFQGGVVLAKFALNSLKSKRAAILTDVSAPYSVGLGTYFKEQYIAGGGQIVAEQKFTKDDKDFKAQLTAIKTQNPDAIFMPIYYGPATLIALQARELGIKVPLFGGDGWEAPELIQGPGAAAALEGCYFSTHFAPDQEGAEARTFVKKYEAKFGAKPDAMGALGYESALVLADAIKRAGSTEGPKIRDALAATKDFLGVTGKMTMDADRNARKPAVNHRDQGREVCVQGDGEPVMAVEKPLLFRRWSNSLFVATGLSLFIVATSCRKSAEAPPAAAKPTTPKTASWLEDATDKLGVNFIHEVGTVGTYFMPESLGSGVAIFDYDNDGRMDILLLQNGGTNSSAKHQLFHQENDGRFRNVSVGSGLDLPGTRHGRGGRRCG